MIGVPFHKSSHWFIQDRVFFGETGNSLQGKGIRSHNWLTALVLSLFGKIVTIKSGNQTVYLNRNSLNKWILSSSQGTFEGRVLALKDLKSFNALKYAQTINALFQVVSQASNPVSSETPPLSKRASRVSLDETFSQGSESDEVSNQLAFGEEETVHRADSVAQEVLSFFEAESGVFGNASSEKEPSLEENAKNVAQTTDQVATSALLEGSYYEVQTPVQSEKSTVEPKKTDPREKTLSEQMKETYRGSHYEALKNGEFICEIRQDNLGRDSILIVRRGSYKKSGGFGTAVTRAAVEHSMKLGFGGRIHNEASWTSHLFHLKMGMIPYNTPMSYIRYQWGVLKEDSLDEYESIREALLQSRPLTNKQKRYLRDIKEVIHQIKELSEDAVVTDEDVINSESEILNLRQKTVDSLSSKFIPNLLNALEISVYNKCIDTSSLTSVNMYMSDEGLDRWKTAIANGEKFQSFKRLEHLRPYMTEEQMQELDSYLDQLEGASLF